MRYLQSDPIGLRGGLNIYSYAYQSPLNFFDPYGLSSSAKFGDAAGALKDGGYSGYSESVQAYKDAKRAAGGMLSDNMSLQEKNDSLYKGAADAMRHCVLACSLTRRLGRATAKSILDRHEERDGGGDDMDDRNNMMGCFLGENGEEGCEEECKKHLNDLMSYRDGAGNLMGEPMPIGNIK